MNLPDPILLNPKIFKDARGFFCEVSKNSLLEEIPSRGNFKQLNHSFSRKNVLRGLHFQTSQEKILRVITGKIWDVVVDIRPDSPKKGEYFSYTLDSESGSLWIPSGFAHGFVALEDTNIIYLISHEYDSQAELGISWCDADLNLPWPIKDPLLSERDKKLPSFKSLNLNRE